MRAIRQNHDNDPAIWIRRLRHGRCGTGRALALAAALLLAGAGRTQEVPIDELGELALEFAAPLAVSERPGERRLLRVDTLPGDRFELRLPFAPNRLQRLSADGARVSAQAPLLRLSGPELGLWLHEADSVAARFDAARERYESSGALYRSQSLSARDWQAISEHYHALALRQRQIEHVRELLRVEDAERALLLAPRPGLLLYPPAVMTADGELPVAVLVDPRDLRLTVRLSATAAERASALRSGPCRVPLAQIEARVEGFNRRLWSGPLPDCIPGQPGRQVDGRVLFRFDGYAVPRAALLRHDGATVVARRVGNRLELVAVDVRGEDDVYYYLLSDTALGGSEVLTRSTSALQGLLLGLGSD